MNMEELNAFKILVRAYYDYQRERLALDGRLGQTKNGELKAKTPERDPALIASLYTRRIQVNEMEDSA